MQDSEASKVYRTPSPFEYNNVIITVVIAKKVLTIKTKYNANKKIKRGERNSIIFHFLLWSAYHANCLLSMMYLCTWRIMHVLLGPTVVYFQMVY